MLLLLLSCAPDPRPKPDPEDSAPATDSLDTGCTDRWHPDTDGDGFGDAAQPVVACEAPAGFIADGSDCDDTRASINPDQAEIPRDQVDQDCDGLDACVDLNCDGYLDIAVSFREADALVIYLGTRDAGYATTLELPTAGATANAIADVNDDGWPDLVSGSMGGATRIYYGAPDDPFTAVSELAAGSVLGLAVADLDGDGRPELVFGQNGMLGAEEGLTIYWNSAAGFAEERREVLPSIGAWGVSAADLDGDGDVDLAVSNNGDGVLEDGAPSEQASWIYWNSGGAFSADDRQELATTGAAGSAAADLDGDGYVDLVFAASADGGAPVESRIYWGRAAGFLEADSTVLPTGSALGAAARDVDLDGYMDVVFSGGLTDGGAVASAVFWGSTSRYSDGDHIELETAGAIGSSVADLDGDSWQDLIFAGPYGAEIWWGPSWPYNPSEHLSGSTGAFGVSAIAGEQGL